MARKAGSAKQDQEAKAAAEAGGKKRRGRPPKVVKDLSDGDTDVSQEVYVASLTTLKKLTKEKDTAVANLRAHRKHCEGLGVNLKAMDLQIKIEKMDEDTRFAVMRNADKYCRYMNLPTGTQFGLFEDELSLDAETLTKKAHESGRFAGLNGVSATENPHQINSPLGQEWHSGWLDGQKAIGARMGPKPQQPSAGLN